MSHFNEYTTFYLRTMKTDCFSCSIIRSSQPRKLFKKGALKLQIAEQIANCKLQIADCRANQWTGFYIITPSVMKELKKSLIKLCQKKRLEIGVFP